MKKKSMEILSKEDEGIEKNENREIQTLKLKGWKDVETKSKRISWVKAKKKDRGAEKRKANTGKKIKK